jgi:hypothetical protein
MKKVIYIASFLVGFVFMSCEKQEIIPSSNRVDCGFEKRGRSVGSVVTDSNPDNDGSEGGTAITDPTDDVKKKAK